MSSAAALPGRTVKTYSSSVSGGSFVIESLADEDQLEVLSFLAARPIHTVIMASLIRDNGLVSNHNRGSFYACRDNGGQLEGIALIGEITLLETRTEAALTAFAYLARSYPQIYLVMGEREKIDQFWGHYAASGQALRLFRRELLFALRLPVEVLEPAPGLRLATTNDFDQVATVHAEMAWAESGINPLDVDPVGFKQRCKRRIKQGRVWVWVENKELIFKADVISETPEAIYLEGVYVNAQARGKGYGLRCVAQLSQMLLTRAKAICVLVNEQNREAQSLYQKCRYQIDSYYDTIFLKQNSN